MTPLLKEIYKTPLLWLLVLVPAVLAAEALKPGAHTLLFSFQYWPSCPWPHC